MVSDFKKNHRLYTYPNAKRWSREDFFFNFLIKELKPRTAKRWPFIRTWYYFQGQKPIFLFQIRFPFPIVFPIYFVIDVQNIHPGNIDILIWLNKALLFLRRSYIYPYLKLLSPTVAPPYSWGRDLNNFESPQISHTCTYVHASSVFSGPGSREEDFKNMSPYFHYFLTISFWKGFGHSFDEIESPSPKDALWQVWLKWPFSSEEVENVKGLWTGR